MSDKELFGVLSLALSVVAYAPYIWSMLRRRIRPHLLSWIVWSLISLIATLAQQTGNAGPGGWAVMFSTVSCTFIALCAFRYGERTISRLDWVCFLGALSAIPLWRLTSDPLASLLLVLVIDTIAYGMTFRKAWRAPWSENATVYWVDTVKYGAAMLAMDSYSVLAILFPLYVIVIEGAMAVMILWRQRSLPQTRTQET